MRIDLDDLRSALDAGPAVALLRHGPRGPVTDPRTGNDVPLTPEGETLARELGNAIGGLLQRGDVVHLAHSPVLRCRQTAEAIGGGVSERGARVALVGARDHLGGPYLLETKRALDLAAELGNGFVRKWFDGEVAAALVQPRAIAARVQVESALDALGDAGGPRLAVLVSHDWNLMLVREHYFGVRHEDAGWIDFLDGVAIQRTSIGFSVRYQGRVEHVVTRRGAEGAS